MELIIDKPVRFKRRDPSTAKNALFIAESGTIAYTAIVPAPGKLSPSISG